MAAPFSPRLQPDLEVGAGVDDHIGDQLGEEELDVLPQLGELEGMQAVGGEGAGSRQDGRIRRIAPRRSNAHATPC